MLADLCDKECFARKFAWLGKRNAKIAPVAPKVRARHARNPLSRFACLPTPGACALLRASPARCRVDRRTGGKTCAALPGVAGLAAAACALPAAGPCGGDRGSRLPADAGAARAEEGRQGPLALAGQAAVPAPLERESVYCVSARALSALD